MAGRIYKGGEYLVAEMPCEDVFTPEAVWPADQFLGRHQRKDRRHSDPDICPGERGPARQKIFPDASNKKRALLQAVVKIFAFKATETIGTAACKGAFYIEEGDA